MSRSVYEPEADREGVREVMRAHMGETKECYLEAIEKRPGAEGKVLLEWGLDADGHVIDAKIAEINPKLTDIQECLLAHLRSWPFPKPNNGESVTVRYPLYFSENGKFPDAPHAP